jgi:GTP-binding protein
VTPAGRTHGRPQRVRDEDRAASADAAKELSGQIQPAPAPPKNPDADPANPLLALPIEFVGSFPDPKIRVEPVLPEIAFIGRSNVGKSSLLNTLVGRPGLARVSGSPGKTTLLNFYRLPEFYLVDLPGYGFAKAGKTARAGYRRLVDGYLRERQELAGVVWLLDIRHQPSDNDFEMQDVLIQSGVPVLAVLTKVDKLTRSALTERTRELTLALGLLPDQVQLTSSRLKQGIAELAESIVATVAREIP